MRIVALPVRVFFGALNVAADLSIGLIGLVLAVLLIVTACDAGEQRRGPNDPDAALPACGDACPNVPLCTQTGVCRCDINGSVFTCQRTSPGFPRDAN